MSVITTSTWRPPSNARCSAIGQRQPRREHALDNRIVGGVQQQHQFAGRAALVESVAGVGGVGVSQADAREDHAERVVTRCRLRGDLTRQAQVRHPGSGEHREFLPADQGGQRVDDRYAGENRVRGRIAARPG